MGSYSSTSAQDNRLVVSGDAGQVTAPNSQLANPLGIAAGGNVNSETRDIYYNDLAQVDQLVKTIMQQNNETLSKLTTQNAQAMTGINTAITAAGQSFSTLGSDILDSVATAAGDIKEPLSRYVPVVTAVIVLFVIFKLWKK